MDAPHTDLPPVRDAAALVEALAALRAVLQEEAALRVWLWDGVYDAFHDYQYEQGYFAGGPHWPSLSWLCSALVFFDELLGLDGTPESPDFEATMRFLAAELYEPGELRVPPGMPDDHWWWFRWTPEPLPARWSGA